MRDASVSMSVSSGAAAVGVAQQQSPIAPAAVPHGSGSAVETTRRVERGTWSASERLRFPRSTNKLLCHVFCCVVSTKPHHHATPIMKRVSTPKCFKSDGGGDPQLRSYQRYLDLIRIFVYILLDTYPMGLHAGLNPWRPLDSY